MNKFSYVAVKTIKQCLLESCIVIKNVQTTLKMCVDTAIDMNEILNTLLSDASDADIDLAHEKNVYNEVSNWDNESLFLLYLRNLLFR